VIPINVVDLIISPLSFLCVEIVAQLNDRETRTKKMDTGRFGDSEALTES